MTGMKTLIELRRSGVKPKAVFIDLSPEATKYEAEPYALSPYGNVNIVIEDADSLNDIDFRPLVGLVVFVFDYTDRRERSAKVRELIAAVEPKKLHMPQSDEFGFPVQVAA